MSATCALRRWICRVLIGVLVFTQMAVAAYACPGGTAAAAVPGDALSWNAPAHAADAPMAGHTMAPAFGVDNAASWHPAMDPALSSLCLGHCQAGEQKPDHPPAPQVFPALLVGLYPVARAHSESPASHRAAIGPWDGPPVPADPPHAILHCCRRD